MNSAVPRRYDLAFWHGVALVVFAASLPLGEGVSLIALAFAFVVLMLRLREVDWRALTRGTIATILGAWGVWIGAGLAMTALGGVGWLKPSEIGVQTPLLATPILYLTASGLDRVWLRRAVTAFLVVLMLSCALGVTQYAINVRVGESLRGVASVVSQGRVPGDARHAVAGGFYFHRLKLAHVLVVGLGVLVARQLYAGLTPARRVVELGALGLAGTALLLTFARAALVGVVVGSLLCALFASRRWRFATLGGILFVVAVTLSVPALRGRVASIAGQKASSVRGLIWSQAVIIVAMHPLGAGIGNYPQVVSPYYDVVRPQFGVRTYPHSEVLSTWAEAGPIGLVAFSWAWMTFLVACVRRLRAGQPDGAKVAAAVGVFGGSALWVVGMTHDLLFHKPVALAFAGMVGGVLAWIGERKQTSQAAGT